MDGYLKLHRKTLEWEWFSNGPTFHVFMFMLICASSGDSERRGEKLHAGQMIIRQKDIAAYTGMTIQQVRTAMNHLQQTGEIEVQQRVNGCLVTVVNWEKYQGEPGTDEDIPIREMKKAGGKKRMKPFISDEDARKISDEENYVLDVATKMGMIHGEYDLDKAIDLCATYSAEWTEKALKITADKARNRSWGYTEAILRNWKENGSTEDNGKKKHHYINRVIDGEITRVKVED